MYISALNTQSGNAEFPSRFRVSILSKTRGKNGGRKGINGFAGIFSTCSSRFMRRRCGHASFLFQDCSERLDRDHRDVPSRIHPSNSTIFRAFIIEERKTQYDSHKALLCVGSHEEGTWSRYKLQIRKSRSLFTSRKIAIDIRRTKRERENE